jgi:hypothetical protein
MLCPTHSAMRKYASMTHRANPAVTHTPYKSGTAQDGRYEKAERAKIRRLKDDVTTT